MMRRVELVVLYAHIVITIAVVDTVDEAVDLANSTEYSLAASLWTKDINKALDVSGRIRSGRS